MMILIGRSLFNIGITVLIGTSAGFRSILTGIAATGTVVVPVMMILLLRPGVLGYSASNVELLIQVLLILIAVYAVYLDPSVDRVIAGGITVTGAVALGLFMIVIYGEAFVAP